MLDENGKLTLPEGFFQNMQEDKHIEVEFRKKTVVYVKYLEGLINCNITLKGYPKNFIQILKELGNMVYPQTTGKTPYKPPTVNKSGFSPSINSTLDQMRKY